MPYYIRLLLVLLVCFTPTLALAEKEAKDGSVQFPRRIAADPRIKTYVYEQNAVFAYTGYYRYQSSIEFADNEEIQQLAMGDPTGWQMTPAKNRLFLKPIDPEATTNMVIFTNKRIYFFELYAEEADGIRDEGLSYVIRFTYPTDKNDDAAFRQYAVDSSASTSSDSKGLNEPDYKTSPEKYNFDYSITGARVVAPLKIFDDGEFTYLQFRNINADLPAIFQVDSRGNESLINYRMMGNYVVIERVAEQFTLRYGGEVACVFNEANPHPSELKAAKKFLGLF